MNIRSRQPTREQFLVSRSDYEARAINASQNSKVGSLLGSFFLKNRIIDGDPFFVGIRS
jgi:hypothetical protein